MKKTFFITLGIIFLNFSFSLFASQALTPKKTIANQKSLPFMMLIKQNNEINKRASETSLPTPKTRPLTPKKEKKRMTQRLLEIEQLPPKEKKRAKKQLIAEEFERMRRVEQELEEMNKKSGFYEKQRNSFRWPVQKKDMDTWAALKQNWNSY